MSDPWADEGFGADDDWEGDESLESPLEDEFDPIGLEESDDDEEPLSLVGDDDLDDE
jgi:hypothetical protein